MRRFFTISLCVLGLASINSQTCFALPIGFVSNAQDNYIHEPSGAIFPARAGLFTRLVAYAYDELGFAVSVGYRSDQPQAELTEYLKPFQGDLAAEFEMNKLVVLRLNAGAKLLFSEYNDVLARAGFLYSGDFRGKEQNIFSYLFLFLQKGWLTKIRLSLPWQQDKLKTGDDLSAFIDNIVLFLPELEYTKESPNQGQMKETP